MFSASTKAASGVVPATLDPQFNYVTMLLHGDGTNGAQNNTFLDSSTNNFTITRNGNTTQGSFSPYGSNWSNYFDGTGDYISAGSNSAFAFGTGTYTAEAWVYVTGSNTENNLFCNDTTNGFDIYFNYSNSTTRLEFRGGSNVIAFSGVPTKNTWTHVALVREGTGTNQTKLYFNGALQGSGTDATNWTVTGPMLIGGIGVGAFLTGYISNARLVKGTAVYTSAFTPSTTPLTAITNTSLLTCQSNRFKDSSSNNFTITVTGNTSVQRFNPFGTSTAYSTSVIGGSGYFDGSDYLAISNGGGSALDMGTGNCTIEMWAYPDTQSTSFPSMFAPKTGWSSGTFYIRYQGSKFGIYWNGVGDPFFESTNTYPPNAWYHVALVRSGTTFTLYVNGVSAGTGTSSASLNLAIGNEVWLGNNTSASCYYKGLLSDVRVVKGTAVYTSTFTPPTAPLTAISGTSLLTNMTNGAIFDNAMMNDLETVGNAQISTGVKKYGTGSLAFDGTGDRLVGPPTYLFDLAGDFTIECWLNLNSTSGTYIGIASYADSSGWYGWQLIKYNTYIQFELISSSAGVATITSSSTVTTGVWYHIAVVRSGSTITLYINGTSQGTSTSTASYSSANSFVRVGEERTLGGQLNGYIDDLRITKGYARYTANFTPPTAAFFNTGPY